MNANDLHTLIEEMEAAAGHATDISTIGGFGPALSEAIGRLALAMHTGDTHRLSDLLLLVAWSASATRVNEAVNAHQSESDYTPAERALRMLDEHAPSAFMLLAELDAATMISSSLAKVSGGDIDSVHISMCYRGIAALQAPIRAAVREAIRDAHDLAIARRRATIN
jgi:hypothetical protein